MWENFGGREAFRDGIAGMIPLGRMSAPDVVARQVRVQLSDDASFVTGQAFVADDGELVS